MPETAVTVIGIDPGIHGALALFRLGVLADVKQVPLITTKKVRRGDGVKDLIGGGGSTVRNRIDVAALAALLKDWTCGYSFRIIREDVNGRVGEGASRAFAFGETVGHIDMAAAMLGAKPERVAPQTWKLALGVPGGKTSDARKKASAAFAVSVFPKWADTLKWTSANSGGPAEATLIGLYGIRYGATA